MAVAPPLPSKRDKDALAALRRASMVQSSSRFACTGFLCMLPGTQAHRASNRFLVASDGAGSSEIGGGVGRMTTACRDRGRELDGGLVDIIWAAVLAWAHKRCVETLTVRQTMCMYV